MYAVSDVHTHVCIQVGTYGGNKTRKNRSGVKLNTGSLSASLIFTSDLEQDQQLTTSHTKCLPIPHVIIPPKKVPNTINMLATWRTQP